MILYWFLLILTRWAFIVSSFGACALLASWLIPRRNVLGYRAARVRAIFELPDRFKHLFPHKLVYIEWFNPFSPSPVKYLEAYTTTKSFNQAQQAQTAVVPLSTVQLTCHLGPRFNTIDEEVQLTPYTDTFAVCRSFILNQFSSYYCFDLLEHWITLTSLS